MTTGRINQGASLELGSAVRVLARAPRGSRAARSGDATTNDDGTNEARQPLACNAFRSLVAIAESTLHERVSFQPPVIEMPVGDTFYLSSSLLSKRRYTLQANFISVPMARIIHSFANFATGTVRENARTRHD